MVALVAFTIHIAGMAVSHRTSSDKTSTKTSNAIPAPERSAAARVASLLLASSKKRQGIVQVIDADGKRQELPIALAEVMYRAAELLAEGRPVTVLPDEEMLSTQAAADILNVSRQYLVRLVDTGELPAEKVGSHRRLRAADVAALKTTRDAKRASALDRLASLSEDVGGYELGTKHRQKEP
ncbi:helix-turn-helix domain-containing protein [Rhizobium sullae]|uniref:helix-turn-helix domain-containing protein n=1 Tax=Rhizobium sullae TaxID=50338 RepID=UPI001FCD0E63|nr:helix-turn-helix domain-containing protein [Rhizobium sullae]